MGGLGWALVSSSPVSESLSLGFYYSTTFCLLLIPYDIKNIYLLFEHTVDFLWKYCYQYLDGNMYPISNTSKDMR